MRIEPMKQLKNNKTGLTNPLKKAVGKAVGTTNKGGKLFAAASFLLFLGVLLPSAKTTATVQTTHEESLAVNQEALAVSQEDLSVKQAVQAVNKDVQTTHKEAQSANQETLAVSQEVLSVNQEAQSLHKEVLPLF